MQSYLKLSLGFLGVQLVAIYIIKQVVIIFQMDTR